MFGRCEFASKVRAATRRRVDNFDLREEPVAAASNGFHKAGTFGGVAEGLTDFVDCFVEPVVEIHESVCGPKFFLKFLTGYDLAGVLKQHYQDLEGLFLKPDLQAVLAQFARTQIHLEDAESESPRKMLSLWHGGKPNCPRVYHPMKPQSQRGDNLMQLL